MKFFKCNCNFKENKSRFRTALLDTQVSKMLDFKKKKNITANIPMIQTKFLQIHVLQMASESSYDRLSSSYDCDSNDFSLPVDVNRIKCTWEGSPCSLYYT